VSEPSGGEPTPPEHTPLTRLDPDAPRRSAGSGEPATTETSQAHEPPAGRPPEIEPVIDTRRYRWMIGIFGLVLVLAISVYQFATHGVGTTGIPAGQPLRSFAAPLAATNLVGDPNLHPPCTAAHHDPRALNLCLLIHRGPVVLSFFVLGSGECERQVDALQTLSRRFPTVQFAAVAVHAGRAATNKLVRDRHWTIPVAYDRDGSVGSLYGVAICPMAELAYRGGIVKDRLIGDQWQTTRSLSARVQALVQSDRRRGRA
jgi:peroxiredoxin